MSSVTLNESTFCLTGGVSGYDYSYPDGVPGFNILQYPILLISFDEPHQNPNLTEYGKCFGSETKVKPKFESIGYGT